METDPQERRRRSRISTMILCELEIGESLVELARVRDLCETGIKIATTRTLLLGDRLRVRLPGGSDWVMARVAWCANGVAGLSFLRAVDLPKVSGASSFREDAPSRAHYRGRRAAG